MCNPYPPVVRGGYEVECRDVVEHLRAQHEITVLTSTWDRGQAAADPGVLRELPSVQVTKRDSLLAPVHALRGARIARRVLARVRPDLVYVWNGARVPYAALQVIHDSGVPVAYRVCEHWFGGLYDRDLFMRHLTPGETGPRGVWARAMRTVNRLPGLRLDPARPGRAAVCWNSEFIRAAAGTPRWLTPVHEAIVIPSNARTEDLARVQRAPGAEPTVMFVATLGPHKGADVAVRALGVLARRDGLRPRLVLAGNEEPGDRARITALAEQEGVGGQVDLPGTLDRDGVLALASRATAWVVPSVWDEPAPLTCVEAALARVPLVASRVGGIPEVVHDEEHALLFDRSDAEGCATALARTLRGDGVAARTARAFTRGGELAFGPYVRHMDRFLADAAVALGLPGA